jgi:hypothetical protein
MFTDYTQRWDAHRVLAVFFAIAVIACTAVAIVAVAMQLARVPRHDGEHRRRQFLVVAAASIVAAIGLGLVDLDSTYIERAESDLLGIRVVECGSALEVFLGASDPSWPAEHAPRPADACRSAASGRAPLIAVGMGAALALAAIAGSATARRRQPGDHLRGAARERVPASSS